MIGWNLKLTIRLNDRVMWVQPNRVDVNEMGYGKWNEWDGLLTEGNENEHTQWSVDWRKLR